MRIIWAECKKILAGRNLLLILAVGALFLWAYLSAVMNPLYEGGDPLSFELLERYGGEMDRQEFEDYKRWCDDTAKRMDAVVENTPECAALGVSTWEEYKEKSSELSDSGEYEQWEAFTDSVLNRNRELYFRMYDMELIASQYEFMLEQRAEGQWTQERTSLMPGNPIYERNYLMYAQNFIFMALVCVVLLTSPLIVRDKHARMREVQYASRAGRGLLGRQLAAALLAAFALITVFAVIFVLLYLVQGTAPFFGCRLGGFQDYLDLWFPLTFGQMIMVHIAVMYLLGLGFAAAGFFLSRISSGVVTLTALLVPLLAGLYFFCQAMLYDWGGLFVRKRPVYADPLIILGVLALGVSLAIWLCRREKRIQIA